MFYIAQLFGIIALVVLIMSFQKNKKDKPYEYPDEKIENSSPAKTKESDSPWLTWGLPEPKQKQTEVQVKEEINPASEYMSALKRIKKQKQAQQSAAVVVKNVRPKKRLTRDDLKRGVIMAEVLGKPRALNPYSDKF